VRQKPDALPDDWATDCLSCSWFLEHYRREDLYLFTSWYYGGTPHVLNRAGAASIKPEESVD
jgi:hypothetical protein